MAIYLIIDPPVGPYDSPRALRAWRAELVAMMDGYLGEPTALLTIARNLENVDEWLEGSIARDEPPAPAGGLV